MTPEIKRWNGGKISEPGLYANLPMSVYHSDCCVGPSISSTGIKQILECPAKYWAFSPLNPNRIEQETTKALSFGKAAHSIVLEKRLSNREFAVSPFNDFRTKVAQQWRDKAERIGLTVLKPDDLQVIAAMYQQIIKHPVVEAGGLDGLVECSLIWQDQATGIWLKSRPDVVPLDDMTLNYKATADASIRAVSRDVEKYGYYISEAMVAMGMAAVLKRQVTNAGLLNQEKSPPYIVSLYELSDAYMAAGLRMVREGIDTFDRCLKANDWPGYAEDNETLVPPDRVTRRAFGNSKADVGTLDDLLAVYQQRVDAADAARDAEAEYELNEETEE